MRIRFLTGGIVVCLSFLGLSALQAQDDVKSELTSIEKGLWSAWKNGDPAPFETHLAEDTVGVGVQGVSTGKQKAIQAVTASPCQVGDFSLSDWQIHKLSGDVVLLTYSAKQDATCGGVKVPSDVVASSIYVRRGGKWLAAFHQESPLMQGAP